MRFLGFAFLLLLSHHALSCECSPLQPISKENSKAYNVIFFGKVDSVGVCGKDGISTAYFTIEELYKGAIGKQAHIDFDCGSACLMSFAKGEEWLIYASYPAFDKLTVSLCEHSRKHIDDVSKDYYAITSQRSFADEKHWLQTELGIQPFVVKIDLNEQQKTLKPHNDQPSGWKKIGLLVLSLLTMLVVLMISKRK